MASRTRALVANDLPEEKFFDLDLDRDADVLRGAIEHALGVHLTELARGMWTATIDVDWSAEIRVTVRALPTEKGTTVEVDIKHETKPIGYVSILAVIPAMILVIPFFMLIAASHRAAQKQRRDRALMFHRIWTEIVAAVGAPKRASYRGQPKRVRVPYEDEEVVLEEADHPERTRFDER